MSCESWTVLQYLADIEEHLGVTIDAVGTDVKVESNEFDGKVVYGQKRKAAGAWRDVTRRHDCVTALHLLHDGRFRFRIQGSCGAAGADRQGAGESGETGANIVPQP